MGSSLSDSVQVDLAFQISECMPMMLAPAVKQSPETTLRRSRECTAVVLDLDHLQCLLARNFWLPLCWRFRAGYPRSFCCLTCCVDGILDMLLLLLLCVLLREDAEHLCLGSKIHNLEDHIRDIETRT